MTSVISQKSWSRESASLAVSGAMGSYGKSSDGARVIRGAEKKKKEKEKRKNYFRGDFLIKKPASSRPKIGQLAHPRCINLPMRMTYMMPGINV